MSASPKTLDIPAPPEKQERPPSLDDQIKDRKTRLELTRLLNQEREQADIEAAARKARAPLTNRIKTILGNNQVGRASWGDYNVNYTASDSTRVSYDKLIKALLSAGIQGEQLKA